MRNWEVFTPTSKPRTIDMITQDRLLIDLRLRGAAFKDIAQSLGYKNANSARIAHHRAKNRMLNSAGAPT